MHRVERITQQLMPAANDRLNALHSMLVSARSDNAALASSIAPYLRITPEVSAALAAGQAVVALESTIISHGMPWPRNLETALAVEAACRANGAIPATIAILGGLVHIGLEQAELRKLAQLGEKCRKCSRRDLALLLARGEDGATTVSATMLLASMAGITLFVTGGIGGVHRGVESTMDVSADLIELSRTPVAVICAGVKSILDIPRTLEFLETFGVPVAAFGVTQFPAFFTRDSGIKAPLSIRDAKEAARMVSTSLALGLGGGAVIAVPVPESAAAGGALIEKATTQALSEASAKGVQGRDITPFLLARIAELTGGESLAANIALILNNVKVGSEIAVEMARIKREQASAAAPAAAAVSSLSPSSALAQRSPSWPALLRGPLVCGGSNLDLLGRPSPGTKFLLGTSNPGRLQRSWGGVGRNVAEVLGRLRTKPHLLSAVGADDTGSNLLKHAESAGVLTSGVLRSSAGNNTSTYMAILDEKGDLFTTIADMVVCDEMQPQHLPPLATLRGAPLLVLDGNVSQEFIQAACVRAQEAGVPVVFEPTSIEKCTRVTEPLLEGLVTFVTPSAAELLAMWQRVVAVESAATKTDTSFLSVKRDAFENNNTVPALELQARAILEAIASRAAKQNRPVPAVHLIVKRGKNGAMIASMLPPSNGASSKPYAIQLRHLPAGPLPVLVNTSGAGDSLVGATCFSLIAQGARACSGADSDAVCHAVQLGMRAAEMTLASAHSVSQEMTPEALASKQRDYEASMAGVSAASAPGVSVPSDIAALMLAGRPLPPPGRGLQDRSGLERWYRLMASGHHDASALRALLAPNCVFHSPVVHTPQVGADLVFAYLSAAAEVLAGAGQFKYLREFTSERGAVLEFESVIDGTRIQGVDMIEWDRATGRIVDFKVMVRPLKAFNKLHQLMAQKLQENAAKLNP